MNSRFQKINKEFNEELASLEQDNLINNYMKTILSNKLRWILQEND